MKEVTHTVPGLPGGEILQMNNSASEEEEIDIMNLHSR